MLRSPQGDSEKVTLQDRGSNVFVLEGALEGGAEMVENLTFACWGCYVLALDPSRLNFEEATEEDGYMVLKIKYRSEELEPLFDPGCALM